MTVGAVILAAGFGTRLAPLTDNTPKPLLEVGGRPVATHLCERLGELDTELAEIDRFTYQGDYGGQPWPLVMRSLELFAEVMPRVRALGGEVVRA